MARGDSTIRVNIIGDAKSLQGALASGERSVGRFDKKMAAVGSGIVAAFAVDSVIDFANTALAEGDRVGDAIAGLERQLGGELASRLEERADDFANLGASRGDILEMERAFADTAVALGQGAPDIADWSEDAAEIAAAFALTKDVDAMTVIDLIGKAAAGSEKPLRELGINLDESAVQAAALQEAGKDNPDMLTDSEWAAGRLVVILRELAPALADASTESADFEQKQAELQAKWETLTGKIGEGLDGPLTALLTWILNGIDGWERFGELVGVVQDNVDDLLTPVARLNDALGDLIDNLRRALGLGGQLRGQSAGNFGSGGFGGSSSGPSAGPNAARVSTSVTVQGGNPADVENAVRAAIKGYATKNGKWFPLE